MPTTAVQDRSTIDPNTVKAVLGITGNDRDTAIALYLAAAKRAADEYMNNPFVKRDPDTLKPLVPEVALAIPADVEEGLVEYVRLRLVQQTMASAGQQIAQQIADGEPTTESVGAWSVGYAPPSLNNVSGGAATAAAALRLVQEGYWRRYRLVGVW